MQPESTRTMFADDGGIHLPAVNGHAIVHWGEIAQICAIRELRADGTTFIEVYVDHFSGVDFRLHSDQAGYEQTTKEMERHLVGFRRELLNAVKTFDEDPEVNAIWVRDEVIQPFRLQPPVVDPSDPTPEERAQMEAAHKASIATCERILGRPLRPEEIACVETGFKNGRIVGNIAAPLCSLLIERQSLE